MGKLTSNSKKAIFYMVEAIEGGAEAMAAFAKEVSDAAKGQQLTDRDKGRLKGIRSIMVEIIIEGLKTCPHPILFPRHCGKRVAAEQYKLFQKGVSKCDGYKKMSKHQLGIAFDFAVYDDKGKPTWSKSFHYKYEEVADHFIKVAKERYNVTLVWGGRFKNFTDRPHMQIVE